MIFFLLGFAGGLGIVCSMAGWGWLLAQALRIRHGAAFGYNAAFGLGLSTIVGGLLNLFHLISPALIRGYIVAGILAAAFAAAKRSQTLQIGVKAAWAYFKSHKTIAAGAALVSVIVLLKFAAAVSPGWFNPQDDNHAYLAFPVKMIQTGSLGQDPFSERRITSSLGGQFFLDTFSLSISGELKNLHLMDMGVAFLILILVLAEIMIRKKVPAPAVVLTLLATALYQAPIANITSVYVGVLLFVVLFDIIATTAAESSMTQSVLLAIVLASIISLKTSFAPAAGVAWLGYFALRLKISTTRRQTILQTISCGALVVLFLLPWMLDSYRSVGTLFYPFLGKGFHASSYSTGTVPSAKLGVQNMLAFFHGTQDTLFVVLVVQAGLLLLGHQWKQRSQLIHLVIAAAVALGVLSIGVGTGGYQVFRYTFPLVFPAVLYLLIEELTASNKSGSHALFGFYSAATSILLLGVLLGNSTEAFMNAEKDWLTALHFSLSGANVVTQSEVSEFRKMQLSAPAGASVLARLDKNFLFDFRRNPIYIADVPGQASLPPGMPLFQGPDPLADYLLSVGVRYLAYSYADEANFSRAQFGDRLEPKVNLWVRTGARNSFDFQDSAVLLGQTRKKLFDDGSMFMVDLSVKAQ